MCVFENTPPGEVPTATNNATRCSLTHGFSRGSEVSRGNKEGREENTVRNTSEAEQRGWRSACSTVPAGNFWFPVRPRSPRAAIFRSRPSALARARLRAHTTVIFRTLPFPPQPGCMRVAAAPRTGVTGGDAGGAVEHALGAAVLDRRLDRAGGRAALQLQQRRRARYGAGAALWTRARRLKSPPWGGAGAGGESWAEGPAGGGAWLRWAGALGGESGGESERICGCCVGPRKGWRVLMRSSFVSLRFLSPFVRRWKWW